MAVFGVLELTDQPKMNTYSDQCITKTIQAEKYTPTDSETYVVTYCITSQNLVQAIPFEQRVALLRARVQVAKEAVSSIGILASQVTQDLQEIARISKMQGEYKKWGLEFGT